MSNQGVAAIIPAHNEEKNIARVIRVLKQVSSISEIIVVDDGSWDNTAGVANREGARVVRQTNTGKAGAMAAGARRTKADILFFADADLVGFTPEHAAAVIDPVAKGGGVMSVGIRGWGRVPLWVMQHCVPVIGGERAIMREYFLKIASHRAARRYGIETVMNAYCARHHIPVILVRMHGVSLIRKEQKIGLVAGFRARLRMFGQIIRTEWILLFDRNL